jgi:hypothetical protein
MVQICIVVYVCTYISRPQKVYLEAKIYSLSSMFIEFLKIKCLSVYLQNMDKFQEKANFDFVTLSLAHILPELS